MMLIPDKSIKNSEKTMFFDKIRGKKCRQKNFVHLGIKGF
jgi:hypothetical protein